MHVFFLPFIIIRKKTKIKSHFHSKNNMEKKLKKGFDKLFKRNAFLIREYSKKKIIPNFQDPELW